MYPGTQCHTEPFVLEVGDSRMKRAEIGAVLKEVTKPRWPALNFEMLSSSFVSWQGLLLSGSLGL